MAAHTDTPSTPVAEVEGYRKPKHAPRSLFEGTFSAGRWWMPSGSWTRGG